MYKYSIQHNIIDIKHFDGLCYRNKLYIIFASNNIIMVSGLMKANSILSRYIHVIKRNLLAIMENATEIAFRIFHIWFRVVLRKLVFVVLRCNHNFWKSFMIVVDSSRSQMCIFLSWDMISIPCFWAGRVDFIGI